MSIFKEYPVPNTEVDLLPFFRLVAEIREDDRAFFNAFPDKFLSGRKVARIPTGSIDVVATDNENDFNWDEDFLYILIFDTVADDVRWRRVALGVW